MTFRLCFVLLALFASLTACKLGPFPDEPVEVPTSPEPAWDGLGQVDAGASKVDAAAPVPANAPERAR